MALAHATTTTITEIARQIVGVIPTAVELQSEDQRTIRYRVKRGFGWRLATVILAKASLRKLAADPHRDVKIEYLRRDLMNSAERRKEFRYPRTMASGV